MSGNETIFSNLNTSKKSQVKLENGALVETKGKGTISIQTNTWTKYINDVLLVPSLEHNLLSVGQMMEDGYALLFSRDSLKIFDKKRRRIILKVRMENRNFLIQWLHMAMKSRSWRFMAMT